MNAPVLNAIDCPTGCGAKARVSVNGSGGMQVHCGSCKFQGWAKTPKAVEALKKRIGAPADDRSTDRSTEKKSGGGGILDDL